MNMSRMTKYGAVALLSLGTLGGTAALAQTQAPAPIPAAPQAAAGTANQATPPSLTQAIAAAEAHAGGKAVEVEWDREHGPGMVEVNVMNPDGTKSEMMVNTADGSVQVKAGDNDRDNHEDEDEG